MGSPRDRREGWTWGWYESNLAPKLIDLSSSEEKTTPTQKCLNDQELDKSDNTRNAAVEERKSTREEGFKVSEARIVNGDAKLDGEIHESMLNRGDAIISNGESGVEINKGNGTERINEIPEFYEKGVNDKLVNIEVSSSLSISSNGQEVGIPVIVKSLHRSALQPVGKSDTEVFQYNSTTDGDDTECTGVVW